MLRDGVVARELRLDDLSSLATQAVEVQARGLDAATVAALGRTAERVVRHGAATLFVVAPGRPAQELVRAILGAGGSLDAIVPRRPSLEDLLLVAATPLAPANTHDAAPRAATAKAPVRTPASAPVAEEVR
jgi:hypothetical protein